MKSKLYILIALVLASSISSIFFNITTDVSADQYGKEDYSSYEDSYNNGYSQEDYSTYNKDYSDSSYDDYNYPPDDKEPKKFVCPNSGIVVDKIEHCPQICPDGTALEGHLVAAGFELNAVCNTDGAEFQRCGENTQLPGVLVTNANTDCNPFNVCPIGTDLQGFLFTDIENAVRCELPTDGGGGGEGECLKCVDLAIHGAPGGQTDDFALDLANETRNVLVDPPGPAPPITQKITNIFEMCAIEDEADLIGNFTETATLSITGGGTPEDRAIEIFETCIENRPDSLTALQENSFTTNVQPQSEIYTSSSPSAQSQGGVEISSVGNLLNSMLR